MSGTFEDMLTLIRILDWLMVLLFIGGAVGCGYCAVKVNALCWLPAVGLAAFAFFLARYRIFRDTRPAS